MWILEKRSVPGSISYELLSNTSIEDYLEPRELGPEFDNA